MSQPGGLMRWSARFGPQLLPFADAASEGLPLPRLLRLALIQVSAGLTLVLMNGVLNRVMIVEMHMAAVWVAALIALPMLSAPLRALIGFKSDTHRSFLGWKRTPYVWFGTLMQWGGLAFTPFFLLLVGFRTGAAATLGLAGAGVGFVLTGFGMHMAQTAGLALASDLAPADRRPRVTALLYGVQLIGMAASAFLLNRLLTPFSPLRLVQVMQGAAVVCAGLNLLALWKQEVPDFAATQPGRERTRFAEAWRSFSHGGRASRLLVAAALGGAGFGMQDVLTEPFGGQVLHMTVGATAGLTGLFALGAIAGLAIAARALPRGWGAPRLAAFGAMIGVPGFVLITLSAPFASPMLLAAANAVLGLGAGLFGVGVLSAAMELAGDGGGGLALGAWGAVQAGAAGVATLLGAGLRDLVGELAAKGALGPAMSGASAGYIVVFHIEILLLFASMAALGPLVSRARPSTPAAFGLAELPG
ncbi:MAG: MFS transporter [Caulobacteraceae bacterium]|nr:MFS transporter [Caulobacter sp.]